MQVNQRAWKGFKRLIGAPWLHLQSDTFILDARYAKVQNQLIIFHVIVQIVFDIFILDSQISTYSVLNT